MNQSILCQRYQELLYYHEDLGFYFDVSRMGFDNAHAQQLVADFEDAFRHMDALEAGAIANPDEHRQVGHYWLRDPDRAPDAATRDEIVKTLWAIEEFVRGIDSGEIHPPGAESFTDILSVGIGGSALGPQFVSDALAPVDAPRAIHFIDNIDPAGIDRTLVIVTSKSGGTPETRNAMLEVRRVFEELGLDFPRHAVDITVKGSAMDKLEDSESWLNEFPMFDWGADVPPNSPPSACWQPLCKGSISGACWRGRSRWTPLPGSMIFGTIRRHCWCSAGITPAMAGARRIW